MLPDLHGLTPLNNAQTRGADPGLRHEVTGVLDAMQAAGLTVVRTWAFNDGKEWNALQTSPGTERLLSTLLADNARCCFGVCEHMALLAMCQQAQLDCGK